MRVPVVVPTTAGVKTTLNVQELSAATEPPQVLLVMAYAAGLAAMLSSVTAVEVLLVIVTVWAALAVPTDSVELKVIVAGLTLIGLVAFPVKVDVRLLVPP